jgi:hypothetical protein
MTAVHRVAILAAVALLASCSGGLRTSFPTEEEVRSKLHRNMPADEVLATFGKPLGHALLNMEGDGKVHYIAPAGTRTAARDGYAGFTVYLHQGKVWDWEIILLNPSYEPRFIFPGSKPVRILVAALLLAGLVFAAERINRARLRERLALKKAYTTGDIPTADLPPDFQFITSATILAEVAQRAGAPTRVLTLTRRDGTAEMPLKAFAYELPYHAAVIVMPEPPFSQQSRIRAVWFRQPRRVREF